MKTIGKGHWLKSVGVQRHGVITLIHKILSVLYLRNCKVKEADTWQVHSLDSVGVQHFGVTFVKPSSLM